VFSASFGPQIRQSMHQHVHLEPIYPGEWSGRVKKGLERLRLLVQIVHLGQSANLAVRGAHFEPTVWITRVESRAETFFPLKTRLPSSSPINRSNFHAQTVGKEGAQNWHKISFSCPVFLQSAFSFLFLSAVASSRHH
jgi:hypothetical protein